MELKPRNINAGRRERMREKFIRNGIDGFLPHEVLEMLLFYPIAYKDTNPLAHLMIEGLGSFANVISASTEDLCKITGVGEQTALFIKAIEEIGSRAFVRNQDDVIALDDYITLGKYATSCVGDEIGSCSYMIMLNNNFELIGTVKIADELFPNEPLPDKTIIGQALLRDASMIALVSHCTDKPLRPSKIEIDNTFHLIKKLDELDIKLLEYYNVSGAQFFCYSRVLPALLQCKPKYELFYQNYPKNEE